MKKSDKMRELLASLKSSKKEVEVKPAPKKEEKKKKVEEVVVEKSEAVAEEIVEKQIVSIE